MNAPDTAFPAQDIPTTIGIAFEGGFYAGRIRVDDALFAIVVSPAAGQIAPMRWAPARKKIDGARSYCDGHANTHELAQAGSKLAEAALGLTIGGFTDWYIPARDELELVYRHFKPGTATFNQWRAGDNPSSVPPGYPYTTDLVQTSVSTFRAGAADALAIEWYWSSTLCAPDAAYAWVQLFLSGNQSDYSLRSGECRARAVRRVAIR